eukprot:10918135-Karenia_brevis.AAC.1
MGAYLCIKALATLVEQSSFENAFRHAVQICMVLSNADSGSHSSLMIPRSVKWSVSICEPSEMGPSALLGNFPRTH